MPDRAARARLPRAATFLRAALVPLLLLAGCAIEEPTLPTYDTEWLIPIGQHGKTVRELIEDEPDFVIGADGAIALSTSGDIDGIAVGDRLDVDIEGLGFDAAIGVISLDPGAPVGFRESLGELYPASALLDGQSTPVPPFTFTLDAEPQDLPGFTSATLRSGGLSVVVENGLPVHVGGTAPPDQLTIRLYDPDTDATILDIVVPYAIASNSTFSRVYDMGGRTIPDAVAVSLTGGSAGSLSPVTVDTDSELAVVVQTTAFEVSEAVASFGAQSFQDTSRVTMPDSVQVRSALIDSGTLVFRMRNDLSIDADATIDIGAFVAPDGQPLQVLVPLAAGAQGSRSIDLSGYTLAFEDGAGDDLEVIASIESPGTDGADVTIRSTDVIAVEVDPIPLSFAWVTGVVDPIAIDLEPSTTSIEIPEDLEDLQLQRAALSLGFSTSLGLPIDIDLHIDGTNADGVTVPLDAAVAIPAVSGDATELVTVVLDQDNSSIVDFLNNLPETIVFSGRARIGDGVSEGTIAASDSVSARWAIAAPMTVALLAQTIESDIEALDLDEDLRQDIDDRLVGLTLEADIVSTLPVEAIAYIGISADTTSVFTKPDLQLGPITIPAAGRARADGTRDGVVAKAVIEVDEDDVPVITQAFAYQGVRIELPGTDGAFVTLHATDEVSIGGFLRARIRMGDVDR